MRKVVISTLLIIIVLGGALLVERSLRLGRETPKTGEAQPAQVLSGDLKLKSFATKELVPLSKLRGKVLLINFWASWCQACIEEMPGIQKLYDTLRPDGFEVLAVNVDENPEKAVPAIFSKHKLSLPVYTDVEEEIAKTFDVTAIPFSAVIDRTGTVVWSESGERDWFSDKVVAEIRELLKN